MSSHRDSDSRANSAAEIVEKAFSFFVSYFFEGLLGCDSVAGSYGCKNHILHLRVCGCEEGLGGGVVGFVHDKERFAHRLISRKHYFKESSFSFIP